MFKVNNKDTRTTTSFIHNPVNHIQDKAKSDNMGAHKKLPEHEKQKLVEYRKNYSKMRKNSSE